MSVRMQDVTEDWTDDYDEGVCDHCGKHGRTQKAHDPYTAEVHPEEENPETWWCYDCHQQRADDR